MSKKGKATRKGKNLKITECPPDDPIYTRNLFYFSPVSKTNPIGTFTLNANALNVGPRSGRAALDLIRMMDGPNALDPIEEYMVLHSLPLTRETYLDLAYPDGLPEDWGPDDEATLPEIYREGSYSDGRGD